ncbi:hypothetical protein ES332_D06G214100v1 [Gossypium tomentosum]|uniref:Uncharacterized protein n=1 Tax=Gossypium tomentosum TaxID=34277 RepID=A0A5D2KLV9_GOSTO|nr:hypothetical protein ES332_D06G214100v1 [Gossypium tomentosum]
MVYTFYVTQTRMLVWDTKNVWHKFFHLFEQSLEGHIPLTVSKYALEIIEKHNLYLHRKGTSGREHNNIIRSSNWPKRCNAFYLQSPNR